MYQFDDVGSAFLSLPPNLQTAENDCFGYALDRQMKRMHKLAKKITVWSDLDNVDPKYYDSLAMTIRAPYYKSEYSDKEKLGLIKSALLTRKNAGTMKAIEELLSHTLTAAEFTPWYEYGGKPYFFKVLVDADEIDDSSMGEFIRKISSVKSARSIFEGIVIHISVFNVEQIVLRNVRFKMGIPFWNVFVFDGSWLLDGSVTLSSKRRYGLALGIGFNQGGFYTSERIQICSVRFDNAKVNTSGIVNARAVFRTGIDFWNNYGLSLGISHKLLITGCTEDMKMRKLTVRWEQYIRESMAANARTHIAVKPLAEHKQEKMAIMVHAEIGFSEQETVENITVETKNKNHWFFNGEFLLDGTKNLNSIYKKEEI